MHMYMHTVHIYIKTISYIHAWNIWTNIPKYKYTFIHKFIYKWLKYTYLHTYCTYIQICINTFQSLNETHLDTQYLWLNSCIGLHLISKTCTIKWPLSVLFFVIWRSTSRCVEKKNVTFTKSKHSDQLMKWWQDSKTQLHHPLIICVSHCYCSNPPSASVTWAISLSYRCASSQLWQITIYLTHLTFELSINARSSTQLCHRQQTKHLGCHFHMKMRSLLVFSLVLILCYLCRAQTTNINNDISV